jgi:hypothetical protein
MTVLGHAAPDLINILIALYIPIENRHPVAPKEDNNHQGCVFIPKYYSDTLPRQHFYNFQFLTHTTVVSIEQIFSSQIMNIQSICLVTFTGKANHFQAYMAVKRVSLRKYHKTFYCSSRVRLRPQ